MNIQTVHREPEIGVVFRRSNILRCFQIAVYYPAGEATALRQAHMDRDVTVATARSLAASLDLPLYEIEVSKVTGPINFHSPANNFD